MSFYIIGTAGHIDHGKTQLAKALTGINTDRLKEEQERGMSIKLGFAPLKLSEDINLGLIDVPGHERFISQMMSGASGMDMVILVIAATEGIMPQTKEHLAVISILGIKNIVVALTKISLVDKELVELLIDDISDYLKKWGYDDVPVIPVDSITNEGIDNLKLALKSEIAKLPLRKASSYPRLPVDRVFSLTGHGTIVTGTLWSGIIHKGDQLIIFPVNKKVKVRNIQVHGENVETALAGQRVALNIPEVGKNDIPSGAVILKDNLVKESFKLIGNFKLLHEKDKLSNNQRVRVHLGTEEAIAKLILLESDEIYANEEQLAGLYLEKPLGTLSGDIIIIRNENNSATLGSLKVIDTSPAKVKRLDEEFNRILYQKLDGTGLDRFVYLISMEPFISKKELKLNLSLNDPELSSLVEEAGSQVILIEDQYVTSSKLYELKQEITDYVNLKLDATPLSLWIPKEEVKSKFFSKVSSKVFNIVLDLWKDVLELEGNYLKPKGYVPKLTKQDQLLLDRILLLFKEDGFMTKSPKELALLLKISEDKLIKYLNYFVGLNLLVKIDESIYFEKEIYKKGLSEIVAYLEREGSIDIGVVKDILGTSRKYIVPLLEYLDYSKITKRVENKRILYRR